jgi:hypothetical protein
MRIQLGGWLWNHSALEHLVGNWSRDFVNERLAHLRIGL